MLTFEPGMKLYTYMVFSSAGKTCICWNWQKPKMFVTFYLSVPILMEGPVCVCIVYEIVLKRSMFKNHNASEILGAIQHDYIFSVF